MCLGEGRGGRFALSGAVVPGGGRWVWSMSSRRRQSLHRDSSVLSGEKPLRKGRLPITITPPRTDSYFSGDLRRVFFGHSFLFPYRPTRGGEERKACDVKDRARAGAGQESGKDLQPAC